MTDALRREDALRSALGRLGLPLVVCEESMLLRPLNGKAVQLFEEEGLAGDLLTARPSHPLAQLVREVAALPPGEHLAQRCLTFPSGSRYLVEPSQQSEKGPGRWIVLLFQRSDSANADTLFDQWELTEREREVARLLMTGLSNPAIAEAMNIGRETVKTHMRSILEKSGAATRTELLATLLRR
jgi:DNA-binding NarL/FixJ family response regulator